MFFTFLSIDPSSHFGLNKGSFHKNNIFLHINLQQKFAFLETTIQTHLSIPNQSIYPLGLHKNSQIWTSNILDATFCIQYCLRSGILFRAGKDQEDPDSNLGNRRLSIHCDWILFESIWRVIKTEKLFVSKIYCNFVSTNKK